MFRPKHPVDIRAFTQASTADGVGSLGLVASGIRKYSGGRRLLDDHGVPHR